MTHQSGTDTNFEEVLAQALELRDIGCEDWLEQACREHPELRGSVSKYVEASTKHSAAFKAALVHDASIGEVYSDRYRVEERLGFGAMGVVYRARDLVLDRDVALKVLRTDMLDPEEATTRFLREAEVMASIQHPAVITVFDRGRAEEGKLFIAMELLDGVALSELLDEGRQREGEVLGDRADWLRQLLDVDQLEQTSYLRLVTGWVADLAAGLEAAHRAGVMHRDVKPSNVFVCNDGRPVLLDFGVAAREGHATLTRAGATVGTPVYMAPESLASNSRPRPSADIYGLAATLYHMLTLRPPYSGSATQVLASIIQEDPRPAATMRPGLPRDLQAILDKGLDRRPGARYASAGDFESDLRAFLAYRSISARPVSPLQRIVRRLRRSKVVQGVVAALFVVGLVASGFALRATYLDGLDQRYGETLRHLPPNFTVVSPSNRLYRYDTDRQHVRALLDQATESSTDPLPSYLLRSSFRLDHGDPVGAAADVQVIADHFNTPLAHELASRYHQLAASGTPLELGATVSIDDLPEFEADADVYLLAYHAMRAGDYTTARALLEDPRVEAIDHAQELRLAATSFNGLNTEGQRALATQRLDKAIRLEERVGQRTAGTGHVVARMLSLQGRYAEALEAARDSIALAERSHPSRITAGMMAWRLGLDEEARDHWLVAIDLQPDYIKPYRNLIWLHLGRGELEEAQALVERAPFGEGDAAEQARLTYRARIETERALLARSSDDREGMLEHARRAETFLDRARTLGSLAPDAYIEINRALLDDDPQAVFAGLADLMREDPLRWRRMELLLHYMPADLNTTSTGEVRSFIEALHAELASPRRLQSSGSRAR